MPWNGRWLLSAAALVAVASLGFWARTGWVGCMACQSPEADAPISCGSPCQVASPHPAAQPEVVRPATTEPDPASVIADPPALADVPSSGPIGVEQPELPYAKPAAGIIEFEPPMAPTPLKLVADPPPGLGTKDPSPTPSLIAQPVSCPWTLRVSLVDGRTQLEAWTEQDVRFRVSCDRLLLQAPDGKIEAIGKVAVNAPDLEGTCQQLVISWHDEKVALEGMVNMTCRQAGQEADLTGDRVVLKLTAKRPASAWQELSPALEAPRPALLPPRRGTGNDITPATYRRQAGPEPVDDDDPLRPLDGPQSLPR